MQTRRQEEGGRGVKWIRLRTDSGDEECDPHLSALMTSLPHTAHPPGDLRLHVDQDEAEEGGQDGSKDQAGRHGSGMAERVDKPAPGTAIRGLQTIGDFKFLPGRNTHTHTQVASAF